jgi:hypothetical protein
MKGWERGPEQYVGALFAGVQLKLTQPGDGVVPGGLPAPSAAYASNWPRPVRPCAGSFSVLRASSCLYIQHSLAQATSLILRLTPLHQQILALLGPTYEHFYESSN